MEALIRKRDGSTRPFDPARIRDAILAARQAANRDTPGDPALDDAAVERITDVVCQRAWERARAQGATPDVETVQDLVVHALMEAGAYHTAQAYTEYRHTHMLRRRARGLDETLLAIVDARDEQVARENSNKDALIASTQRDYLAGAVSKDVTWRLLLDPDIRQAHEEGVIHFHDADYFIQRIINCSLVNLKEMLTYGTVISDVAIDPPKSIRSAANIAAQIIAQVASNQYGGQTFSLAHLAPYVHESRMRHRRLLAELADGEGLDASAGQIERMAERLVERDVQAAVQTIQYQLVTLMTTNGQTPFVSMVVDLSECGEGRERDDLALLAGEVLRQRIRGVKDEHGLWIAPAFPKILYVLDELTMPDGVDLDRARYGWLTRLAARCTAARMVPDYISAPVMMRQKGDVFPCMGCRSFLTPDRFSATRGNLARLNGWDAGSRQYYGRFNQGVVTVNLPDVALCAHGDEAEFWRLLDERLELCHRALRARHERLLGTPSDVSPVLFQHGAIARLAPGESIDRLLYDGYSTLSLGYAGLYEATLAMTGQSHTSGAGHEFAMRVMEDLNRHTEAWKRAENIDYSLYGTPLESTTEKFASALRRRHGLVEGVTDHGYVTNSYHVNVREEVDAFTKLDIEAAFQNLSPGGAVSYVETPDLTGNPDAVLSLMRHMKRTIMYAEVNGKIDCCTTCGSRTPMKVEERDGRLSWCCPACGESDERKIHVARRTCGYIGSHYWNQGRTEEIRDRVEHVAVPML